MDAEKVTENWKGSFDRFLTLFKSVMINWIVIVFIFCCNDGKMLISWSHFCDGYSDDSVTFSKFLSALKKSVELMRLLSRRKLVSSDGMVSNFMLEFLYLSIIDKG